VDTAEDMGSDGNNVTAPIDGCLKIENYPEWWDTRAIRLQAGEGNGFPVTVRVVNSCTGLDQRLTFTTPWQQQVAGSTSEECPTLLDLEGTSSSQTIVLRYFGGG